jgi:lipopolysaccharide biosynthesis glycosyltransferase
LNACFHGRRKRLDYKWNGLLSFFREPPSIPLAPAEIEAVRREARVIHFNGNSKPWSYLCEHPRKAEYEKYLRMTEWRDFVPEDRTVANILRKRLSPFLPAKIKTALKSLARRSSTRPGKAFLRITISRCSGRVDDRLAICCAVRASRHKRAG